MKYILAMLMSFLLVAGIIPFLMKLSIKYNFTDKPTKRKIHRGEIPLCGGIAMFIGSLFLEIILLMKSTEYLLEL